jgi:hypothetical protein
VRRNAHDSALWQYRYAIQSVRGVQGGQGRVCRTPLAELLQLPNAAVIAVVHAAAQVRRVACDRRCIARSHLARAKRQPSIALLTWFASPVRRATCATLWHSPKKRLIRWRHRSALQCGQRWQPLSC